MHTHLLVESPTPTRVLTLNWFEKFAVHSIHVERRGQNTKTQRAQRHKEGRHQELFKAAFFVSLCPLCLCVFTSWPSSGFPQPRDNPSWHWRRRCPRPYRAQSSRSWSLHRRGRRVR